MVDAVTPDSMTSQFDLPAVDKKRLDDFDQYARAILVYLESQAPQ